MFKGAFPDPVVVDGASDVFRELIEEERASGTARGDHFAKPGANDRVWSALDKMAVRAPDVPGMPKWKFEREALATLNYTRRGFRRKDPPSRPLRHPAGTSMSSRTP